jgi:hypothetical protein
MILRRKDCTNYAIIRLIVTRSSWTRIVAGRAARKSNSRMLGTLTPFRGGRHLMIIDHHRAEKLLVGIA